jgi:hypothetical protein
MWTDRLADGGDAGYALVFKSETRLGREQAVIQLYCIGITLGMVAGCVCHVAECAAVAMGSGLGTGLLLRSPLFNSVGRVYDDNEFWEVPEEVQVVVATLKAARSLNKNPQAGVMV